MVNAPQWPNEWIVSPTSGTQGADKVLLWEESSPATTTLGLRAVWNHDRDLPGKYPKPSAGMVVGAGVHQQLRHRPHRLCDNAARCHRRHRPKLDSVGEPHCLAHLPSRPAAGHLQRRCLLFRAGDQCAGREPARPFQHLVRQLHRKQLHGRLQGSLFRSLPLRRLRQSSLPERLVLPERTVRGAASAASSKLPTGHAGLQR